MNLIINLAFLSTLCSDPIIVEPPVPAQFGCYDLIKRNCVEMIDTSAWWWFEWCNGPVFCPPRVPGAPLNNLSTKWNIWSVPHQPGATQYFRSVVAEVLTVCSATIIQARIDPDTCSCEYLPENQIDFIVHVNHVQAPLDCETPPPAGLD